MNSQITPTGIKKKETTTTTTKPSIKYLHAS